MRDGLSNISGCGRPIDGDYKFELGAGLSGLVGVDALFESRVGENSLHRACISLRVAGSS